MPAPLPVETVLVMQPTRNRSLQAFRAATMAGRTSPDSRGRISAPRMSWPRATASSRNSTSKRPASISERSNRAQALWSGLVALTVRMKSDGRPRSRSNRLKASKGDVVITPPKSQITASIVTGALLS